VTTAQKNLYWREWGKVVSVHGWGTVAGRLAAQQRFHAGEIWQSPQLNELLASVLNWALAHAASTGRDVSADNLRHACHVAVVGRQASSKSLNNSELDKILNLFRVLHSPTLTHLNAWQDGGEAGESKRHLFAIRRADAAYVARIARDKFGTADIENLTLAQLRQLSLTLRHRPRAYPAPQQLIAA
jgi:hypothetical protein